MAGFDPGFFLVANFLIISTGLFALRAVAPHANVMRVAFTLVGAYLLYLVAPRFVVFFFGFWIIVWLIQLGMSYLEDLENRYLSRLLTALGISIPLLPLFLWKLFPEFFIMNLNESFSKFLWTVFPSLGYADAIVAIAVPLGLSFSIFRALDMIIKVRLEQLDPLRIDRVLYYGFFPPVLAVGPIIEYEEVKLEGRLDRFPQSGDFAVGGIRVLLGAVKIFLLSILITHAASLSWADGTSVVGAWAAILLYALYFYVNFSGYSDLAIGASRFFGFRLKENFDNPYFKTNPSAFWNAWHMSLTRWVYRYVFVPLGGMRQSRQYIAIFATIMVIALWHDISLPLLIFGFYHGAGLLIHRYFSNKRIERGEEPSSNPLVLFGKGVALFVFVSLSLPLHSLDLTEIPAFYINLIPGI